VNRDKLTLTALICGVLFLVFYWTYSGFNSATANAETAYNNTIEKTGKALDYYMQSLKAPVQSPKVEAGLLSFIEDSADALGLSNRLGDMKPIHGKGGESVSVRVDSVSGDVAVSFIRLLDG
jgi:hypothetical protein